MARQKGLHTPEGVRDQMGAALDSRTSLTARVEAEFRQYGYLPIETPTFEYLDVFTDGTADGDTRLYKFFDREGSELALRPDFTPAVARFVAKFYMDETRPLRFFYEGSVFKKTGHNQGKFSEQRQMGIELIGDGSAEADAEVIVLLVRALRAAGLKTFRISIGNAGFFRGLCRAMGLDEASEEALRSLVAGQNYYAAGKLMRDLGIPEAEQDKVLLTAVPVESPEDLRQLGERAGNPESQAAVEHLLDLYARVAALGEDMTRALRFDLSMLSQYQYYTGIIFKAYTYGVGEPVAAGGRYDRLLGQFGKDAPAVGFMTRIDLVMDALRRQDQGTRRLTVALTKGRLAEKTLTLFEKAGYDVSELRDPSTRKLLFDVGDDLRFFLAKGPDVPTYVELGAADIGVVGADTIMEENRKVYEVMDLGFGKCRMCVCGPASAREKLSGHDRIRVATKYPDIARDHFYNRREQTVDIIKLNGSVELGPIVSLSDVIVDIVETGGTLRENGLEVLEEICDLSARVIVNPVSMQMESEQIRRIMGDLRDANH